MQTARTTLKRQPNRGAYDRQTVYAVLDEALVCHLGFALDGQPYVLPTIHARVDDRLYVHGAVANRTLSVLRGGAPCCITATLVDGLVLARSAFHHSLNFRSVVVLGRAADVTNPTKKLAALQAIVEKVVRGRSAVCRPPDESELRATSVLRLPLDEASAKLRTGPPVDADKDYALPHWAGVVPLRTVAGPPLPDPRLAPEIAFPHDLASELGGTTPG